MAYLLLNVIYDSVSPIINIHLSLCIYRSRIYFSSLLHFDGSSCLDKCAHLDGDREREWSKRGQMENNLLSCLESRAPIDQRSGETIWSLAAVACQWCRILFPRYRRCALGWRSPLMIDLEWPLWSLHFVFCCFWGKKREINKRWQGREWKRKK